MQKYTSLVLASILATVPRVSAMPPPYPPGGWQAPLTQSHHSVLYDFVLAVTPIAASVILFSQLIISGYIVVMLFRIYIKKSVQLSVVQKWVTAFFSIVYLLSIIAMILSFVLRI